MGKTSYMCDWCYIGPGDCGTGSVSGSVSGSGSSPRSFSVAWTAFAASTVQVSYICADCTVGPAPYAAGVCVRVGARWMCEAAKNGTDENEL